jgi:hypothetical protein
MAEAFQDKLSLQRRHAFESARHREFIGSLGYAIHLGIVDRHRGLLIEPLPLTIMCCEVGEREAARAYSGTFFIISRWFGERATTAPSRHALVGPVRRKSRGRFGGRRGRPGRRGGFQLVCNVRPEDYGNRPCAASSISKKAPQLSPAGLGVREGWGAESRTGLDYAPRWRQLRDIASRRRGARLALIAGAAQKERVTTIVSE